MSLLEVQLGPYRVVTFDGHALEIFGGEVRRFHIKLMTVKVSAPDKKGQHEVVVTQANVDTSLLLDDSDFMAFQPVLAALREAGVAVTGG